MDEKEKIIRKVASVAKWNGGSIALFGGLSTLVSLALQDWGYVLLGIAVTSSGVLELKGRKKLLQGQADAGKWLKGSQLWLIALIFGYAGFQILGFDPSNPLKDLPPDAVDQLKVIFGMSDSEFGEYVTLLNYAVYSLVMLVTFLYQGGMWLYYKLKTSKLLKLDSQTGF